MATAMKMQCKVRSENGLLFAMGSLFDNTPFELQVDQHDVILNEELTDGSVVDGWLLVKQESQQEDRVYLTLPKPTINFGRQVVVSKYCLLPINVQLKDFNPKF
jgi:hypothetical protein